MPSINESKIAKKFGINVREPSKIKDVCVPKDEMPKIQEMWNNYETILKKNRHRRVVDKLRNVTKLGTKKFNKSDGLRIASLVEAFEGTDNFMQGAEKFFRNCEGHSKIEMYADKIEEDYNTLNGKDYLKGYNRNNKEKNKQFDKNRFLVFGDTVSLGKPNNQEQNPCGDNYAEHVKKAYELLYNKLSDAVKEGNKLESGLKKAKEKLKNVWDHDVTDKLQSIQEFFYKIDECDKALDTLAQDVSKHKRENWIKNNFDSLKERINMTLDRAESIKKISSTKYLEAIFYDEGDLANAKNLTTALMGCAKRLNAFGLGIQSGSLTTEKLKKTYRDAVKEYERFSNEQNKLREGEYPVGNKANEVNKILKIYKKLDKAFSKLSSTMDEYNKQQDEFLDKYRAWKKEKNDAKRRKILFILFSIMGVLSAGIIKLLPLVDALGNASTEAPVESMPS